MVNYELYVPHQEKKFHSTNIFAGFVFFDLAILKVYESYSTFFYLSLLAMV